MTWGERERDTERERESETLTARSGERKSNLDGGSLLCFPGLQRQRACPHQIGLVHPPTPVPMRCHLWVALGLMQKLPERELQNAMFRFEARNECVRPGETQLLVLSTTGLLPAPVERERWGSHMKHM